MVSYRLIFLFLVAWLLALANLARAATCSITGQVLKADGTADANDTIWFIPAAKTQVVSGVTVNASPVSTTTDANGNLTATSLVQGITLQVVLLNGGGAPISTFVPFSTTSTFAGFIAGSNLPSSVGLNNLMTATGNYNDGGFLIQNLGQAATNGDSLAWNKNATVNNLTINGTVTGASVTNSGGVSNVGSFSLVGIGTPNAPVIVSGFTSGTTWYYFCVGGDINSSPTNFTTVPSNGTGTTARIGTMSCSGAAAAIKYYLLRNTASTIPSGIGSWLVGSCSTPLGGSCNVADNNSTLGTFTAQTVDQTALVSANILSLAAPATNVATPTYGATVTPDLNAGGVQFITVTNGTAWTLANPLNVSPGQNWAVDIFNNSGGVGGTITLGSSYKSDGTLAAPATGKRKRCLVTNETTTMLLFGNCTADM